MHHDEPWISTVTEAISRIGGYRYRVTEFDEGNFRIEYVEDEPPGTAREITVHDLEIDSLILAMQQARDAYRAEVRRHDES